MKTPVQSFHAGMREHFKITNAGRFIDPLFIQLRREVKVDVIALDDWLCQQHPEYVGADYSMHDLIAKHYGEAAAAFVKSFI